MNSNYSLETTLREILQVVNPTKDDWDKRFQVIKDIRAVVESLEVLRGATVEPFGSFVSNLFTRWGDLDISIELPNGSYISSAGKKYKETLLFDVLKALKRKGGFHGIKYISHARVPILNCNSNKDKISCDISINNLSGQMKSKLLFWINEIDGRFRDIVLIVKEWAKAHGINDPKTGTLNSHSLSLLVVFHFQTCEPPILPPLSEVYPGNMTADLTGVRALAEKNIEDICSRNIDRIKADMSRRLNRSSLSDLFISFLAKFCDISLRASTQGISPHNGQWEDIDTNMIWQPKTYALFIEDPFEQPTNCARAVGQRNLFKIAQAFQSSHQKLTSSNLHHPLSVLVRPEVLSIISRSQAGSSNGILGMNPLRMNPHAYPNPNGIVRSPPVFGNNSTNNNQRQNRNGGPQAYRGAHAPTQVQQQQPQQPQAYRGAHAPTQVQPQQQQQPQPQQQRFEYHNSPNIMVNQRPLVGSQSQNPSRVEFFPNNGERERNIKNGVNQRPPGQFFHNQKGLMSWKPKPEK